jgi:four helix bundle protein
LFNAEWGVRNAEWERIFAKVGDWECRGKMQGEMDLSDLKLRTKVYALRVIRLVETLPRNRVTDIIGKQLLRSATSVGANYRAACRAKSSADFIAKMGIVEEEADESLYWVELLIESGLLTPDQCAEVVREGNQLVAITVSSIKTARNHIRARNAEHRA